MARLRVPVNDELTLGACLSLYTRLLGTTVALTKAVVHPS